MNGIKIIILRSEFQYMQRDNHVKTTVLDTYHLVKSLQNIWKQV